MVFDLVFERLMLLGYNKVPSCTKESWHKLLDVSEVEIHSFSDDIFDPFGLGLDEPFVALVIHDV